MERMTRSHPVGLCVTGAVISGLVWAITKPMVDSENIDPAVPNVAQIIMIAFVLVAVAVLADTWLTKFARQRPLYDNERENAALADLSTDDHQLATLLEYNRQQVLRYHDIVTKQAAQSFRAGQMASSAGLVVIGVCLWVGLKYHGTDVKWFSGAIAGIGTAISAYINRTYIHMYKESIQQLNQYFDQPVITGYYLTAERMAKLDMNNSEFQQRIIESILDSARHISVNRAPEARKPESEASPSA